MVVVMHYLMTIPSYSLGKTKSRLYRGRKNFGDQDVIAPAVRKDAPELLNWLNNEIQTLGKDGRLKQATKNLIASLW